MATRSAALKTQQPTRKMTGETVKTTINLTKGLLEEARRTALAQQTTLREIFESGLRRELRARTSEARPFELRDGSFRGEGVQPGIDLQDWDQIRSLIYEGRGG